MSTNFLKWCCEQGKRRNSDFPVDIAHSIPHNGDMTTNGNLSYGDLVGKWATIDGTLLFVHAVKLDGDDEILDCEKIDREPVTLIASGISSVSA